MELELTEVNFKDRAWRKDLDDGRNNTIPDNDGNDSMCGICVYRNTNDS